MPPLRGWVNNDAIRAPRLAPWARGHRPLCGLSGDVGAYLSACGRWPGLGSSPLWGSIQHHQRQHEAGVRTLMAAGTGQTSLRRR